MTTQLEQQRIQARRIYETGTREERAQAEEWLSQHGVVSSLNRPKQTANAKANEAREHREAVERALLHQHLGIKPTPPKPIKVTPGKPSAAGQRALDAAAKKSPVARRAQLSA